MKQIAKRIGDLTSETVAYEKLYADREVEFKAFVKRVEDYYKNKIQV